MTSHPTHRTFLTVRGYELDSYGHVNNAVYLQYFEQARWEYLKELGFLDKIQEQELLLVVVETTIRYIRESNLFDQLDIETSCRVEGPFVIFNQKIFNRKSELPVTRATVKSVFVDKQRVPQDVPGFMSITG